MELSVIIVSWNVRRHLLRCLESLKPQIDRLRAEVLVVDNASTDGTPAAVRSEHPWVELIESPSNLGFPAGNNLGLSHARGDLLFLLNPDTEVQPGCLEALLTFAGELPRAGVVGPQLLGPDGAVQSSRRRFPRLWTALLEGTSLEYKWPTNPGVRHLRMLDAGDQEAQPVDWLYGAALLVRRAAAAEVGPMDEAYFMYSEELDWCRRIGDTGWEVWYCPQARVIHHQGQSSGQVVAQRDILFHAARIRYFSKFHGSAQARLLQAFLLLDYLYRLLEEGLKWLVGHKRPMRAARVRTYLQVLRSGLQPAAAAAHAPRAPEPEGRLQAL